ncbi:MAG: hypothetical protein DMG21_12215 [Acidobacteria bacterium]|nr:MAG: hypothetical protein DMG21_12215 [Acidobacteriota bacterium]
MAPILMVRDSGTKWFDETEENVSRKDAKGQRRRGRGRNHVFEVWALRVFATLRETASKV